MLFNTISYAFFFAYAFVGSWALSRAAKGWARILFLLVLSYGFYAAWRWEYLPLIFASSTVDFFLARAIARETDATRRKRMLVITVVLNLGFLGFFKYWNFAVENALWLQSLMTGRPLPVQDSLKVLLPPVGISFFTFESMSYVIDVYRGDLPPHRSYLRYLLFVCFFPHLVAGPIVRPRDLLPQLERVPSLSREMGSEALFLIAIGLIKKVVIADRVAELADLVFDRPDNYSALEVLSGVYAYAVQIYCDFSGYTDIAIGSALLLGVRFPKNFDSPYKASNLQDFWRRWHISLSTWLRDYLYVPLGGNRGGTWKTYRNLMLTMVLGGLWHGASWTFVFWGFLHGLGLSVTRAFVRSTEKRASEPPAPAKAPYRSSAQEEAAARAPSPRAPGFSVSAKAAALHVFGVFGTFHYVCLAWIFFRAQTFGKAISVLRQMATFTTFHPRLSTPLLTVLGVGLVSHFTPEVVYERALRRFTSLPAPLQGLILFCVAVILHEAASARTVPFVYFQF